MDERNKKGRPQPLGLAQEHDAHLSLNKPIAMRQRRETRSACSHTRFEQKIACWAAALDLLLPTLSLTLPPRDASHLHNVFKNTVGTSQAVEQKNHLNLRTSLYPTPQLPQARPR